MKLIFVDYRMEDRVPKTVYVKNYSDFKFGIKVTEGGTSKSLELYEGSTKITADSEQTQGHYTFEMKSGAAGLKVYRVKVGSVYLDLNLMVQQSNVADISEMGKVEAELREI